MLYDCFNFYNELELLEIRLNELDSVVDYFVLVEGTVTFTNQPKPLFYAENKEKFKKFHKKIIHIIVADTPDVRLPWIIESFQFSAVARGLKNCRPDDRVMLSCVDELPRKELVARWKNSKYKHTAFAQTECCYYLNLVATNSVVPCTQLFSYKDLCSYPNAYTARFSKIEYEVPNGGWHFTFMGGIKKIQNKLTAFSHQEYNNDRYNTKEQITRAIKEKKDPLGRGVHFTVRPLEFLPSYVQKNHTRFKDLLVTDSELRPLTYFEKIGLYVQEKLRLLVRSIRRSIL